MDGDAATACVACAHGRFQLTAGQTVCIDCAAGQYQDNVGRTDCIDVQWDTIWTGPLVISCRTVLLVWKARTLMRLAVVHPVIALLAH